MLSITGVGVVPDTVTVSGSHMSPVGRPEQVKVTGPLKPFEPVSVRPSVPVCPPVTVKLLDGALKAKLGAPATGATVMEAKRPLCSVVPPDTKYSVLVSPNAPPCPKNISHSPGFAMLVAVAPEVLCSEPTNANVSGS